MPHAPALRSVAHREGVVGAVLAIALAVLACSPIPARDPDASPDAPADLSDRPSPRDSRIRPLARGEPMPALHLVTANGDELTRDDLAGTITVVTFFTARCPDDMCPRLLDRLSRVREELRPDVRARTRFLAVTLDPEHDDLETLAALGNRHGTVAGAWEVAAPQPAADLAEVAGIVTWQREDGSLEHNLLTMVFDDRGRLADRLPGLQGWTGRDLLASVAHVSSR